MGTDGNEHNTTALVDSGVSENFVDKAYAKDSGIPKQQKATPRRVLTMDGSEVTGGPVTHNMQVHLTINHHEEDIRLHCITIGNVLIILGLSWLKLHDPVIGWKNHTVKFHLDHCTERCLPSSPRANCHEPGTTGSLVLAPVPLSPLSPCGSSSFPLPQPRSSSALRRLDRSPSYRSGSDIPDHWPV